MLFCIIFHRFCYIWAGNLERKVTRCTTLQFFYIFRLRSNLHKDGVVCRILIYDLQACEDVNIPGPRLCFWIGLTEAVCFDYGIDFSTFFPLAHSVVCLSAAAATPGPAPLSCCSRPCGFTSPPFWPSATRNPTSHRLWLGPAGSGSLGKSATLAGEGWKKPPWPGAPR